MLKGVKLIYVVLVVSVLLVLPAVLAFNGVRHAAQCHGDTSSITSMEQLQQLREICR